VDEGKGGSMRIAVASGKGGTGKTTVATSLALSLGLEADRTGPPPLLLDCDVEAPNAHLFLAPEYSRRLDVAVMIPRVDESRCTGCGRCSEVCQYHAIVVLGSRVSVFPQLCHGCGSCTCQCPEVAVEEIPSPIGVLEAGPARGGVDFARGVLNVGEPMAGPIIRRLKRWALPRLGQLVILDCPPGTSCPVVEAMRGADFVLLVTEPTPFGLHDLKLAAGVARELHIPAGVIVNRDDGGGYPPLERFCAEEGLRVLLRIPLDRAIAEGLARGDSLVSIRPDYAPRFRELISTVVKEMLMPSREVEELVGIHAP
jgi:MinD superfamily P-loop ATPase